MAEQRVCSFCGQPLEPGTGTMFVKRDGTVHYFDKRRCEESLLEFHRVPREWKWTRHYPRGGEKAAQEALAAQQVAAEVQRAQEGGAAGEKKKAGRDVKVKPS